MHPNPIPGTTAVPSPGVMSPFEEAAATHEATMAKIAEQAAQVVETTKKAIKKEKADSERKGRSNDKKVAAERIFQANKDKGNGEIAQLIAKELEITYANAYYYVTRAFKR